MSTPDVVSHDPRTRPRAVVTVPPDADIDAWRRQAAEAIAADARRRSEAISDRLCHAIAGLAHVEPRVVHDIVAEFDQAMDGDPAANALLSRLRSFALTTLEPSTA